MKNIKNKNILRILAFVLAFASILTVSPVNALSLEEESANSSDAPKIMILYNGAQQPSITLNERESELLTVFTTSDSKLLNWQILVPDSNQWVNISGKNAFSLEVTYALVKSMLNNRSRAALRCKLSEGENVYYSEPVEIVVSYDTQIGAKENIDAAYSDFAVNFAPIPNEAEDFELVSIVINYIFDNGGMAFEPYGASVAKNTDFSTEVESPKVAGYDPFIRIDGEYIDATKVTLNYTKIQENVVINVIYLPALVDFKVHHHLQDLYDDAYSETADYITEHKALTGSQTPKTGLELSLPGFSVLSYEEVTVAADGSTVVEIRYNRNYYLINFDMDEGYGTEPIYTRFGSEIGANPPTKHGYSFDGWELVLYGENAPTPQQASQYDINTALIKVPDVNLTYRAKWITLPTTYTMVFWCENIENNGFTYMGYLGDIPAMSGDTVSGADRINEAENFTDGAMFTYCDARTDKDVIVEGDGSTVVNVYYTRNRYAITFKGKGLCVIDENHTHTHSECYDIICKGGHIHNAECNPTLVCPITEHATHTDECIICGKEGHVHSASCCGLAEHTHTVDCWENLGNVTNKPSGATNNPTDGYI